MERIIIPFKNEIEANKAEECVNSVYLGEVLRTKDNCGLILPAGVLDWSVVFAKAKIAYRGVISI